jgi:tripartite-type tricarboxylate transporter receptor subunit TctC
MMKLKLLGLALAATLVSQHAFAQNYPNRAINVVVPYAPGGNTDVVGRLVAEHMSKVFLYLHLIRFLDSFSLFY